MSPRTGPRISSMPALRPTTTPRPSGRWVWTAFGSSFVAFRLQPEVRNPPEACRSFRISSRPSSGSPCATTTGRFTPRKRMRSWTRAFGCSSAMRFRIHELNVDDVVSCILPYHEAKQFVPMVAILRIGRDDSRWSFLRSVQRSAVPLDRSHVIRRCRTDRTLLDFIASSAITSARIGIRNPALDALFAATSVGLMRAFPEAVDENMLAMLLPHVLDMARAKAAPDSQAAAHIVLLQLGSQMTLSAEAVDGMVEVLARRSKDVDGSIAVRTILYLCLTQPALTRLSDRAFKRLVDLEPARIRAVAAEMVASKVSEVQAVDAVCAPLVSLLLARFITDPFWSDETFRAKLLDQLKNGALPRFSVEAFARSFAAKLANAVSETGDGGEVEGFRDVAEALESNWGAQAATALDAVAASSAVRRYFRGDTANGYSAPGSTANLVVDLNSVAKSVRLGALEHLLKELGLEDGHQEPGDEGTSPESGRDGLAEIARETVLRRLAIEDDKDVLLLLLGWDGLTSLFSGHREAIFGRVLHIFGANDSKRVRVAAFRALARIAAEELTVGTILMHVLSSLLITSEVASSFLEALLDVCASFPESLLSDLTEGLREGAEVLGESASDGEPNGLRLGRKRLGEFNRVLVNTVSRNLASSSTDNVRGLIEFFAADGPGDGVEPAKILFALATLQSVLEREPQVTPIDLRRAAMEACVRVINTAAPVLDSVTKDLWVERGLLEKIPRQDVDARMVVESSLACIRSILLSTRKLSSAILWTRAARSLEKPDGELHSYESLIRTAFEACASSAVLGPYQKILEVLFKVHLGADAVAFLSSFWFKGTETEPRLLDRTLRMALALIPETGEQSVLLGIVTPVLCYLANRDENVRGSALSLLEATQGQMVSIGRAPRTRKGATGGFPGTAFGEMVVALSAQKAEIVADGSRASEILARHFSDESGEQKGKEDVVSWLIAAARESNSVSLQIALLQLLERVSLRSKLASLAPSLQALLAGPGTALSDESEVLARLMLRSVDAEELNSPTSRVPSLLFGTLSKGALPGAARGHILEAVVDLLPLVFPDVAEERQGDIVAHLLNLTAHASQTVLQHARDALRSLNVDGRTVTSELRQCMASLFSSKAADSPRKKAKVAASEYAVEPGARDWLYLVSLLEHVQYGTGEGASKGLIAALFELLGHLNDAATSGAGSTEYARQLTLEAARRCLESHDHTFEPVEDSVLRVDNVVQCLRSSDNPQTHSEVLMLLTTIAKTHAELVVHNIMPVFTFLGTNMLRQDDNYSFFVIRETIATLVPRLVEVEGDVSHSEAVSRAKPIVQVFVDALQHIPAHRRLDLFVNLVEALDPTLLDLVFARLLEKFVLDSSNTPASAAGVQRESFVEFGLLLASRFSVEVRLDSAVGLLRALDEQPARTGSSGKDSLTSAAEPRPLSDKQLRQYRMVVTDFVGRLLAGKELEQHALRDVEVATAVPKYEPKLLAIVELLLLLVTRLTDSEAEFESSHLGRFWKAHFKLTYTVLAKVNDLLSIPTFLKIVRQLMTHESIAIRRKVVGMFGEKVFPPKWASGKETVALFKAALEELFHTVRSVSAEAVDEELSTLRRSAIRAMSLLAEKLHGEHADLFVDAIPAILGPHALGSSEDDDVVASMDALASLCRSLGPRALGHLPRFMPMVMSQLGAAAKGKRRSLRRPGLQCTLAIVIMFPQFMGPHAGDLLDILFTGDYVEAKADDAEKAQDLAEKLRQQLSSAIPPRSLIPVFAAEVDKTIGRGRSSLAALFRCVSTAVASMSSDNLVATYKALFKIYARAFDLRRLAPATSAWAGDQIDLAEADIAASFVAMVMKLNEGLFKPMFVKLVDWSTPDSTKAAASLAEGRQLVFYKLLDALLDSLKTLFVPYVFMVADQMLSILEAAAVDGSRQSGRWTFVVSSLAKSFLHDTEGLWRQDGRADKIMKALVDQLEAAGAPSSPGYIDRMKAHVVPCVAEYAVAAGSERAHKSLNLALLAKCRSSTAEVRLAALWSLQAIWEKLGDELLPHLPQTVPILADLLEDDDPLVERTTRELALRIQAVIGEDLMTYMTR
ncbi:armadillo-type protein [Hyaloraphidium curvatum]|nr:armadillo-type protein [Hyaloraphidium curvatum]